MTKKERRAYEKKLAGEDGDAMKEDRIKEVCLCVGVGECVWMWVIVGVCVFHGNSYFSCLWF